jgi:hypothetical protein
MAAKSPRRRFIKERRTIACPACLDREERYLDLPEWTNYNGGFGPCEMCGKWRDGQVHEVFPVGNEWRRYPWVIVS